ncbi:MAG: glycosyltransferase family 4 protein [Pseudomonadota bacterium]
MRIILTANTAFALINFRLGLIRALKSDGHEVFVLVPQDATVTKLIEEGCQYRPLQMNRRGTHVFEEAATVLSFLRVFRELRPDAVLSYTIKNNLYGGISARALRIPFIPNVTGLGKAFAQESMTKRAALWAYQVAFARCPTVFFQNKTDMELMISHGPVSSDQAAILPGSGVNLDRFRATELPGSQDNPTFLFVGRMLWDKGVGEFVEAAKGIKNVFPKARFQLLGDLEVAGEDAVSEATVRAWHRSGDVEYLGSVEDVRSLVAQADCVVLPSYYREGTPRSLLEAAAMARPLITTKMPGCEDVVTDGTSGYLVDPRSVADLQDRMAEIARLTPEQRTRMGHAGRSFMEEAYDEACVISAYRNALNDIT